MPSFAYRREEDDREPFLQTQDLGGGAALDLGVYSVSLALHFFGRPWKSPGTGKPREAAPTCAREMRLTV